MIKEGRFQLTVSWIFFTNARLLFVCAGCLGLPRKVPASSRSGRALPLLPPFFFSFRPDDVLIGVLFKTAAQAKVSQCPLSSPHIPGFPWLPGAVLLLSPSRLHYSISAEVRWRELVSLCLAARVSILVSISPLKNSRMEKQHAKKKTQNKTKKQKTVLTICLLNDPLI